MSADYNIVVTGRTYFTILKLGLLMEEKMTLQPSCPKCHHFLDLPDADKVICHGCKSEYNRIDSAWDFRVIDELKDNQDWDPEAFDAGYKKAVEGFEDGLTHAAKQGIPVFLENYRMSEVKDRIAPWIIAKGPESIVLDLGCGHGWYGIYLVEKFEFKGELFGVDVSPFNINTYIKALTDKKIRNIHPFTSTAEALPFADSMFDLVFSTEVLEHVQSPENFFKSAARVLKPGGELIITTPSGPMCCFWESLAWFPQKVKHLIQGKKSSPNELKIYDVPMSWRVIRHHAKSAGLNVKYYTKAVFLPHESYLQFFPRPIQYLLLCKAKFMGALKSLTTCLGLHHIIRLEKPE